MIRLIKATGELTFPSIPFNELLHFSLDPDLVSDWFRLAGKSRRTPRCMTEFMM